MILNFPPSVTTAGIYDSAPPRPTHRRVLMLPVGNIVSFSSVPPHTANHPPQASQAQPSISHLLQLPNDQTKNVEQRKERAEVQQRLRRIPRLVL